MRRLSGRSPSKSRIPHFDWPARTRSCGEGAIPISATSAISVSDLAVEISRSDVISKQCNLTTGWGDTDIDEVIPPDEHAMWAIAGVGRWRRESRVGR
jgi:hypothetical protein